jgi:hypothetical protein
MVDGGGRAHAGHLGDAGAGESGQKRPAVAAEITNAAMSERAACVMLNKGLSIIAAVRVLDDMLRRMQAHQSKKTSRLRTLSLALRFAG